MGAYEGGPFIHAAFSFCLASWTPGLRSAKARGRGREVWLNRWFVAGASGWQAWNHGLDGV